MNAVIPKTAAEEALGIALPHRRMEEWKWTDLRRMLKTPYAPQAIVAAKADIERLIARSPFARVKAKRIIFVNGILDASYSQLTSTTASTLPSLLDNDDISRIGAAVGTQGVNLRLDSNIDQAIEIIHIATDAAPRAIGVHHRIEIANGATATLIETFLGEGDYLSTAVIEISLGEGARLDRIKVESESSKATHLSHAAVTMAGNAVLRDFTFTSGSAINRQNGTYRFSGQNSEARISGAMVLNDKQHSDTRLVIDHAVPHCTSRELFKVVLDDHARGIFQGKVIVRPNAQKTDGKQSCNALLLTETAEFDAKPELEIYADDVVCGHGATAGDLNHDHMFYLSSRGIPPAEAKAMLVSAFVAESFDSVENDFIREALSDLATEVLTR